MIVDRDFPKDAIDGDPPPIDVYLPAFAEVPRPDQTGSIHLQAVVNPAAFAEQKIVTSDFRHDRFYNVCHINQGLSLGSAGASLPAIRHSSSGTIHHVKELRFVIHHAYSSNFFPMALWDIIQGLSPGRDR